ncbi:MAG: hypothetical protein H0X29_04475 [Parachlamydiaceae bacterium]|nr:hypothetical protein [Parachlamydiaceae bacterium]
MSISPLFVYIDNHFFPIVCTETPEILACSEVSIVEKTKKLAEEHFSISPTTLMPTLSNYVQSLLVCFEDTIEGKVQPSNFIYKIVNATELEINEFIERLYEIGEKKFKHFVDFFFEHAISIGQTYFLCSIHNEFLLIKTIKELKELKCLNLNSCPGLSDLVVAAICSNPRLAHLEILMLGNGNVLTNEAVKRIAESPNMACLEFLNFNKCEEITDEAIEMITKSPFMAKLKSLNFIGCEKISDEALVTLRKKLPLCLIYKF